MITTETAKVYKAGVKGRRYFSKDAAVKAESVAIIKRKYPTVAQEPDTGYCFHWSELNRSDVMLRRMMILVKRGIL